MMEELPAAPLPERTTESVLQTWRRALTRPDERTYADIAASPRAKATTAFLWVFLASLFQIFLGALVQSVVFGNMAEMYGLDPELFGPRTGTAAILTSAICGAPIGAAITTLVFALVTFVVQWLAKMFGGTGTYDQLTYALAAIVAPFTILSGIGTLFSAIPYVGLCITAVFGLAGLYVLVLEVMAVKGVNRFGWGAAIGSFFIPAIVVAVLCACLVSATFAALFPLLQENVPNFAP
jgi:hypothetical protein